MCDASKHIVKHILTDSLSCTAETVNLIFTLVTFLGFYVALYIEHKY